MNRCFISEEQIESPLTANRFNLRTVYLYSKYCNLKCRHCWINPPYSQTPSVQKDEASLNDIIYALGECKEMGMRSVKLTGGEPFTRSDLPELLEYLKANSIRTNMETNAVLIREKEAKLLKSCNVSLVAVSLDGPNKEVHEALRGVPGSFEDTLCGIKALVKEKINVQIIASLWKGNKEYIQPTIELAQSLGASSFKINPIQNICRADAMVQREETLKVKEIIEFYQNLLKEAAKSSLRIIFDIPPAFKPIKNMRIENMTTCGIFNILGILGDGTISICGIGSNVNTLRLGRIKIDPIKDIWENHPVLKEIRENIPNQLTGICGRCMLKCYCLGKCRAEAYYTNGSLNAPLSFCQTAYEEGFFPGSRIIDK